MTRTMIAALATASSITSAYAEEGVRAEAPPPSLPGSLALPAGTVSAAITVEVESSAGKLGEPIALAPDVAYGVTRDLTLSVVHSKFALTGFRAVTGGGVCLGGATACPHVYNNAGFEALQSLRAGPLAIAAVGGVHAIDFDRGFYDLKLGMRVRYTHGRASIITLPSVLLAMTERTDQTMGTHPNKDMLYVPILASYKVTKPLALGLGSGIKGALAQFDSTWEIPLGAVATYAIDRRVTLGCSLVFGKLVGGADDPPAPAPPATGTDYRGTQVWVTVVH